MNLSAFTQLAVLGKKLGVDLWGYESEDGKSLKSAYECLIPYPTTGKEWEYKQITSLGSQKRKFARLLDYAGKEFNEPRYSQIAETYLENNSSGKSKNQSH